MIVALTILAFLLRGMAASSASAAQRQLSQPVAVRARAGRWLLIALATQTIRSGETQGCRQRPAGTSAPLFHKFEGSKIQ